MPRVGSKAARRVAGLFVASAALVVTAACGGGADDSANGAGGGGNGPGGTNPFAAYMECLNKNGVTLTMPSGGAGMRPSGAPGGFPSGGPPSGMPLPSGSAGPGGRGGFPGGGMFAKPAGVDDATWQKAQDACSSLRPTGGPGMGNRGGGQRRNAAYENCLKDNGVTSTDNLDPDDATTKKAIQTCQVLRQQPEASATPSA